MKDVKTRFREMISNLNYSQIRLSTHTLNIGGQVIPWMRSNMLPVVEQLEPLGWDLSEDKTWLNTMFITEILEWYGKKVAVFITDSFLEYQAPRELYKSSTMKGFWDVFGIDAHVSVLVDTTMFMTPENLDDIHVAMDLEKVYSFIDLSGYDDDDNLLEHLEPAWGFLSADNEEEWSSIHKMQTSIK